MHEGGLSYALTAEHYDLSFKTVCHSGASAIAGGTYVFEVCRSTVLERASWTSLPLLVQGLRLSWWLFRRTTKENDRRTSLMARVKSVSQAKEAGLMNRNVKIPVLARRAVQWVRDSGRARMDARWCLLATGQVLDPSAAEECLIISSAGNVGLR